MTMDMAGTGLEGRGVLEEEGIGVLEVEGEGMEVAIGRMLFFMSVSLALGLAIYL